MYKFQSLYTYCKIWISSEVSRVREGAFCYQHDATSAFQREVLRCGRQGPQKQPLRWSSVCRRFTQDGSWDQHHEGQGREQEWTEGEVSHSSGLRMRSALASSGGALQLGWP